MNTKINKYDISLIVIIMLLSIFLLLFFNKEKQGKYAYVYYENKIIKKIDLNIDNTYIVKGYNGKVKIKVKNNKIKVTEENSPKHLCSKQGYIKKTNEQIICLPNKIVIEIEDDLIDTVVK